MSEIVFAQLCKNVSSVEEATSTIMDLYGPDHAATAGTLTGFGGNFEADFSSSPKQFTVKIDGAAGVEYTLSQNVTDVASAIICLNAALDGSAGALSTKATVSTDGEKLIITSKSEGASSSIEIVLGDNYVLEMFGDTNFALYVRVQGTAEEKNKYREIQAEDFINLFYSRTEAGNTEFNMNLDKTGLALCMSYFKLNTAWYEKDTATLFQVSERVPLEYANMMGIGTECFDTCSLMRLRSELLELEDLCNVCKNQSVICCSLNLDDLIDTLNDGDNTADRLRPSDINSGAGPDAASASDGSTFINATDGNQMFSDGDNVAFSVLITNPSNKVKDVELKLHFNITN